MRGSGPQGFCALVRKLGRAQKHVARRRFEPPVLAAGPMLRYPLVPGGRQLSRTAGWLRGDTTAAIPLPQKSKGTARRRLSLVRGQIEPRPWAFSFGPAGANSVHRDIARTDRQSNCRVQNWDMSDFGAADSRDVRIVRTRWVFHLDESETRQPIGFYKSTSVLSLAGWFCTLASRLGRCRIRSFLGKLNH
jgi:hypothetical protein